MPAKPHQACARLRTSKELAIRAKPVCVPDYLKTVKDR
jgi:hypothetical protein